MRDSNQIQPGYFPRLMCVCAFQVSAKQFIASRERDFFRWMKLPIPIYKCQVPVRTDASKSSQVDGRGTASISVVLPSDYLQALYDQGPDVFCHKHMQCTTRIIFKLCFSIFHQKRYCIADLPLFAEVMAECLGSEDDFGKIWRASGRDHMASTHIPIIIHEDGVPHFSGIWACMHEVRFLGDSTATNPDNNRGGVFFFEAAPPRFGAGALDVSGMILGKAGTLSPLWELRR